MDLLAIKNSKANKLYLFSYAHIERYVHELLLPLADCNFIHVGHDLFYLLSTEKKEKRFCYMVCLLVCWIVVTSVGHTKSFR